jgi:transcription elongation factor Elf1
MGRPHKCPYCLATNSVAKGFRNNRSGKVRLRRCKECGRRWTVGPASDQEHADVQPHESKAIAMGELSEEDTARECQPRSGESESSADNREAELPLSADKSPDREDPGGKEGEPDQCRPV